MYKVIHTLAYTHHTHTAHHCTQLPLHRTVPTSAEAFHVYCYKGPHPQTPSALLHVWDTIEISVATSKGVPPVQLVPMEYNNTQGNAGGSHLSLSPVGESCVEVKRADHTPSSDGNEYVLMATRSLSLHYPLLLAIGLALFFVAPSLSRLATPYTTPTNIIHRPHPLQEHRCVLLKQCASGSGAVPTTAPLHLL